MKKSILRLLQVIHIVVFIGCILGFISIIYEEYPYFNETPNKINGRVIFNEIKPTFSGDIKYDDERFQHTTVYTTAMQISKITNQYIEEFKTQTSIDLKDKKYTDKEKYLIIKDANISRFQKYMIVNGIDFVYRILQAGKSKDYGLVYDQVRQIEIDYFNKNLEYLLNHADFKSLYSFPVKCDLLSGYCHIANSETYKQNIKNIIDNNVYWSSLRLDDREELTRFTYNKEYCIKIFPFDDNEFSNFYYVISNTSMPKFQFFKLKLREILMPLFGYLIFVLIFHTIIAIIIYVVKGKIILNPYFCFKQNKEIKQDTEIVKAEVIEEIK